MSVNRTGTAPFRMWRQRVYDASVLSHTSGGQKITVPCTVKVRYFRRLDRVKDVDNILKAILDGLNGRGSVPKKIEVSRILSDDRVVERVVSQRTDLKFHTALDGAAMTTVEFAALLRAEYDEAAVSVIIEHPPSHQGAMS